MECKVKYLGDVHFSRYVLIETLWNVKIIYPYTPLKAFKGFNRNIVECKEAQNLETINKRGVLIETLWNVKSEGRQGRCRG